MQLAGAVRGEHDHRRHGRRDGAELGDGHLPGREHLEQERLELVVGPVDLVDEQHGGGVAQGPQHRAGDEEALVEQALLDLLDVARGTLDRLERPHVQDLAGEVPVVEGLGRVDALVALQPDERQVHRLGERLGQGGLAGARLALHEQRPAQAQGEPGDRREGVVGEVAGLAERIGQVVRRAERRPRVHGASIPDDVPIRKRTPAPGRTVGSGRTAPRRSSGPCPHRAVHRATGRARNGRRHRRVLLTRPAGPTECCTSVQSRADDGGEQLAEGEAADQAGDDHRQAPVGEHREGRLLGVRAREPARPQRLEQHPAGQGRPDHRRQHHRGAERVEGEPADGQRADEQRQAGAPPGQRGALLRAPSASDAGRRPPGIRAVSHR